MPARKSTSTRRKSAPKRARGSRPRRASQPARRFAGNAMCFDKRAMRAWEAARMGCNVAPMTDFPYKPEEVVHVKGFASGMWDKTAHIPNTHPNANMKAQDFGGQENLSVNRQTDPARAAQGKMTELLGGQRHKVLVWDGDALADDSYTKFIEIRAKSAFKDYILAPFVKKEDLADRIKSWKKSPVFGRMTFYVTPNFANWKALGVAALFTTGSRHVLCLGGGETVQDELKTIRIIDPDTDWGKGVTFHAFPFKRYAAEKNDQKKVVALKIEEGWLTDTKHNLKGSQLKGHH